MKLRSAILATFALVVMSGIAYGASAYYQPFATASDVKCTSDVVCAALKYIVVNSYTVNGVTGIAHLEWQTDRVSCTTDYIRPAGTSAGQFCRMPYTSVASIIPTMADLQAMTAQAMENAGIVYLSEYAAGTGMGGGYFKWSDPCAWGETDSDLSLPNGVAVKPTYSSGTTPYTGVGCMARTPNSDGTISAQWYGFRGNAWGIPVQDGAMTSGSTTLTSASATSTNLWSTLAQAGDDIFVWKAGSSGHVLQSTIASVYSDHLVLNDANASGGAVSVARVVVCRGCLATDAPGINAALARAANYIAGALRAPESVGTYSEVLTGAKVSLSGSSLINSQITWPYGTGLAGTGNQSSILFDAYSGDILRNSLTGTVDGQTYGGFLRDFGIVGDRTQSSQRGLAIANLNHADISGVSVIETGSDAEVFMQAQYIIINHPVIMYGAGKGIVLRDGITDWATQTPNGVASNDIHVNNPHITYMDGDCVYTKLYAVSGYNVGHSDFNNGQIERCNYTANVSSPGTGQFINIEGPAQVSFNNIEMEGPGANYVYVNGAGASIYLTNPMFLGGTSTEAAQHATTTMVGTLFVNNPGGNNNTFPGGKPFVIDDTNPDEYFILSGCMQNTLVNDFTVVNLSNTTPSAWRYRADCAGHIGGGSGGDHQILHNTELDSPTFSGTAPDFSSVGVGFANSAGVNTTGQYVSRAILASLGSGTVADPFDLSNTALWPAISLEKAIFNNAPLSSGKIPFAEGGATTITFLISKETCRIHLGGQSSSNGADTVVGEYLVQNGTITTARIDAIWPASGSSGGFTTLTTSASGSTVTITAGAATDFSGFAECSGTQ